VHRAKIAFTMSFQAPWRPHQVSNTIGENSTPFRPHESALSRFFCSTLSLRNIAALPRRGLPVAGFGWTMVKSTERSRLPPHAFIPGDVHLAVMRDPGYGKDLAEKGLSARVPFSEAGFLHDTVGSPNMFYGPLTRGHGPPAQSAGSKVTPRCHFTNVE